MKPPFSKTVTEASSFIRRARVAALMPPATPPMMMIRVFMIDRLRDVVCPLSVHREQLLVHPSPQSPVRLFQGIFASSIPMPHQSVTPAKTSPAPTKADRPKNAG
jgi:hypothetical protein